jgi:YidC/Oxa1 family membrane protein insertase
MEKRTILAIVLSFLVLFVYSLIISRFYPIENNRDTAKESSFIHSKGLQQKTQMAPSLSLIQKPQVKEYIEFENDKLKIIFTNPGAYISQVTFKEYNAEFFIKDLFWIPEEGGYNFKVTREPEGIVFTFRNKEKEIIKRFSLPKYSYSIELERIIRNLDNQSNFQSSRIFLASKIIPQSRYENRFMELAISQPKKILRRNLFGLKTGTKFTDFDWVGMRDRYFAFLVYPHHKTKNVFIAKETGETQIVLETPLTSLSSLNPNSYIDKFTIYLGPQDVEKLATLNLGFENILYFGFFDTISQVLLAILKFFFKFVHNWGGAILLFGLFIFLLLYPLTIKQMRSIKEMQILQPKIKALQEKYKTDPQRLNREMMQLYREHKVNPLGGCLPLLFQIPIFIALYQALMRFVGLRGARFLWIKDLSQPDRLFILPQKLPIIGNEINILPLLMMVSMFIQQRFGFYISPRSGGAGGATVATTGSSEQQKIMMIVMPLLFGIIFYHMPSGLVLYWIIDRFISMDDCTPSEKLISRK